MPIELCILASGSAGNCTVVRCPAGVLLIDIGIGPRTAAGRLVGTGVSMGEIRAVCLTHLDRDHFNPSWLSSIVKHGIQLFCHEDCVEMVLAAAAERELGASERFPFSAREFERCVHTFNGRVFQPLDGLAAHSIRFQHDEAGSHGFLLAGFGCRVGYATDLGRVPAALIDRFIDLDVLALESNYDPRMEMNSARPWFLKQRIMGGSGHLSNEQALAAVRTILDRHEQRGSRLPSHIVLLHRSRECNCPKLLRRLFAQDVRIAQRLTLAEQYERSEWLRVRPVPPGAGEQLVLGWT